MLKPLCLFVVAGTSLALAQAPSVPASYQDLYNSLNTQIASFESTVQAGWNHSSYPVLPSAELEAGTSDNFTGLLTPGYYANNVIPEMDELQSLGAGSVTVHINFPILYQPFYSSNPSLYQQFVGFYQQLAADVRARGMKLIVENVTATNEPGTQASSFYAYYQSLPWATYMMGRAQNAVAVAQLIQPDYMTVITEPDTEATFTGQANAGTVSGSTQLLQTVLSALQAANVDQSVVQIGAGAGTWIYPFPQFIQSFSATSVQFIDMHVYPINRSFFTNLLTAADIAHAAGKQVGITEAWLYKVSDSEVGTIDPNTAYARDPFNFWQPLDSAFHQAIIDYSQYKQLTFITPAWPRYFFAYLDYATYGSQSPNQILTAAYQASAIANRNASFTNTGQIWENAVLPAPDTAAPAVPAAPSATVISGNSVQVSWTTTSDNVGVAGYNLYRDGTLLYTTSYLLTFLDQNLASGATYHYSVVAFDAAGNTSPQSAALTVQTLDNVPPSVPAGLTVTSTTSNTVSLAWQPSTDNVAVAGYMLMKGTSANALNLLASTPNLSFTDTRVKANTTYYYAVKAYDGRGLVSAPGPVVRVTTPAAH